MIASIQSLLKIFRLARWASFEPLHMKKGYLCGVDIVVRVLQCLFIPNYLSANLISNPLIE